jgi:NAD(P)-dependent dehydrogenase (short-subunit alcohol dehydrogenase family)
MHAILTGGAGAIGTETARLMLEAGATVSVIDSDPDGLDRLARTLSPLGRIDCICASLDSADHIESAFSRVFARPASLIHLVGLFQPDGLEQLDRESWNRTIRVNLTSAVEVAQCFLRHRQPEQIGRIVLFDSIASARGSSGHLAYSAAKGGIGGLMRALARDLAPSVLVNSVSPGLVDSPMGRHVIDSRGAELLAAIPLRRFAQPAEIAPMAAFLAGPQNTYVTGQTIHVDGGAHMT